MKKHVLLGLLLLPGLTHAMCEKPVTKYEDALTILYIRGDQAAKREYSLVGVLYTSGIVCTDGAVVYTTSGKEAIDIFEKLEAAESQQQ